LAAAVWSLILENDNEAAFAFAFGFCGGGSLPSCGAGGAFLYDAVASIDAIFSGTFIADRSAGAELV
jgi:hypothetical protein